MFNTYQQKSPTSTWRAHLEKIKVAQEELRKYSPIMTDWEKVGARRVINDLVSSNYRNIYNGIKQEWEGAITKYKKATSDLMSAKSRESARWDASKLGAEMQTFKLLLEEAIRPSLSDTPLGGGSGVLDRVKKLYQDYQISDDLYKVRASAEVVRNLPVDNLPRDAQVEIRVFGREAETKLEALRKTEDIQMARDAQIQSAMDLFDKQEELREIGQTLGEDTTGPFASGNFTALSKMAKVDRETGNINLYTLDDPEVTGIDWSQPLKPDPFGEA